MITKIKEIFEYRDMIGSMVRRDLRGRYKGSVIGFFWNFINPLCQIIVYYIVFSRIFENGIDKFHVYLIVGMMPWNFFSESLAQGAGAIVSQADMTKKIYFPREVLPISAVTSRFVNLLLTFIIIFAITIASGVTLNATALICLPLVLIVQYILCLGFALILSVVDVYFRDVEYMTGVFLMAWIWLTPIMYTYESIENVTWLHWVVWKNPMTPIITSYQNIIYYHRVPDMAALGRAAVFAVVLLIVGELIFNKFVKGIAEEL